MSSPVGRLMPHSGIYWNNKDKISLRKIRATFLWGAGHLRVVILPVHSLGLRLPQSTPCPFRNDDWTTTRILSFSVENKNKWLDFQDIIKNFYVSKIYGNVDPNLLLKKLGMLSACCPPEVHWRARRWAEHLLLFTPQAFCSASRLKIIKSFMQILFNRTY